MEKPIQFGIHLTLKERRGIQALCCLVLFLIIIPKWLNYLWPKPDLSKIQPLLAMALEDLELDQKTVEIVPQGDFDPNTASLETLLQFGLNQKTANTIIKYREKGGTFYTPHDLKKIYHLTAEEYERVAPFVKIAGKTVTWVSKQNKSKPMDWSSFKQSIHVHLPDSSTLAVLGFKPRFINNWIKYTQKGARFVSKEDLLRIYGADSSLLQKCFDHQVFYGFELDIKRADSLQKIKYNIPEKVVAESENSRRSMPKNFRLDINEASIAEWQYLPGIGQSYANRICKFREKLGGFISVDQVSETFGLPDSVFSLIKPYLILETPPSKISINTASIEDLAGHPYISYKEAKLLINYRTHHGPYSESKDLKKIKVLDEEWINRILPYLKYE